MEEKGFVEKALGDSKDVWNVTALQALASLKVPDTVLGRRRALLRADAGRQWAQWFVESLVDPRRYTGQALSYPRIFSDVLAAVDRRFPDRTRIERVELASTVSKTLKALVEQIAASGRRVAVDRTQKSFLIDVAGDPARCWICGTPFDTVAIDNFIFGDTQAIAPATFIDVLKPRGLSSRDGLIQIDHVFPVALGGDNVENLALACGWCNRAKSAATSIYDVEGRPRPSGRNAIGLSSLPQPFWVVRQLGTVRTCEYSEGCDHHAGNSPLTVAPATVGGAVNPQNLITTCLEHDPLRSLRFQPADVVRVLWGK